MKYVHFIHSTTVMHLKRSKVSFLNTFLVQKKGFFVDNWALGYYLYKYIFILCIYYPYIIYLTYTAFIYFILVILHCLEMQPLVFKAMVNGGFN